MWVLGFSPSGVIFAGWARILEQDGRFPFAQYRPEAVVSVDDIVVLVDLCSDPPAALHFLQELVSQHPGAKLVIWGGGGKHSVPASLIIGLPDPWLLAQNLHCPRIAGLS